MDPSAPDIENGKGVLAAGAGPVGELDGELAGLGLVAGGDTHGLGVSSGARGSRCCLRSAARTTQSG
jgi:hypothetical protein